jgi:hypothetical protein
LCEISLGERINACVYKKMELGTEKASIALIKDLYVDLRKKMLEWAKITGQTGQARIGYIGQHLVSVVTGYKGAKTGARGFDLKIGDFDYGEIKTCSKVDQMGSMVRPFADVCAGLRVLADRPSRLGFSRSALRILAPAFALMVFLSPNYAQSGLPKFFSYGWKLTAQDVFP